VFWYGKVESSSTVKELVMFNVITNSQINKKPLSLKDALSLAQKHIYVSQKDIERAKFDFETGCKDYKIVYGFSSVWIERA
jgi:hypothetical protein